MNTSDTRQIPDHILQEAIDEALIEGGPYLFVTTPDNRLLWDEQAPARLTLARALLARLPEPANAELDSFRSFFGKASQPAMKCQFCGSGLLWSEDRGAHCDGCDEYDEWLAEQPEQASLEAGIKRMEAVSVKTLEDVWDASPCKGDGKAIPDAFNAVRARLIAAAREGQPSSQPAEITWIEWKGGECPVPKGTLIDVRYRDGAEKSNIPALYIKDGRDASESFWENDAMAEDIIAYRVTKWREGQTAAVDWQAKYEEQREQSRQYLEWSAEWQARAEKVEARIAELENKLNIHEHLLNYWLKQTNWIQEGGYGLGGQDRIDVLNELFKTQKAALQKAEAELARIIAAAHEAGWNGVENSKDLAQFIKDQGETLEKWSEHIHPVDHDRIVKRILADYHNSQLRPISESGPVPEGCVRVTAYKYSDGTWIVGAVGSHRDTHFADIRLPIQLH